MAFKNDAAEIDDLETCEADAVADDDDHDGDEEGSFVRVTSERVRLLSFDDDPTSRTSS